MPKLPKLQLARLIVLNYLYDDFSPVIIYGNLRMGKSAYFLRCLSQVIKYFHGKGFNDMTEEQAVPIIKKYMGWQPSTNVELWLMLQSRDYCFCWDDAGYWLHSMNWHDPIMVSISQYMNVVGTDYNTFCFTSPVPTWILSKIQNMPEMLRIKIVKRSGGISDADSVRFSRRAIAYKQWRSPDLKKYGVNKVFYDDFSCKIPEHIYSWYKPVREKYSNMAKQSIRENLMRKLKLQKIEDLKTNKRLSKLEDEYEKLLEKSIDAELSGEIEISENINTENDIEVIVED